MATDSLIGRRWEVMREALDERQRRLLVATEAKVLGRGGVSAVAAATGVSRSTIMAGLNEIELMHAPDRAADEPTGSATRMRRAGGGRKRIEAKDETLVADLLALVDPLTRGDPQLPLRWTCKSLRTLADQLKASGHSVSHVVVGARARRFTGWLWFTGSACASCPASRRQPDRDPRRHRGCGQGGVRSGSFSAQSYRRAGHAPWLPGRRS